MLKCGWYAGQARMFYKLEKNRVHEGRHGHMPGRKIAPLLIRGNILLKKICSYVCAFDEDQADFADILFSNHIAGPVASVKYGILSTESAVLILDWWGHFYNSEKIGLLF